MTRSFQGQADTKCPVSSGEKAKLLVLREETNLRKILVRRNVLMAFLFLAERNKYIPGPGAY